MNINEKIDEMLTDRAKWKRNGQVTYGYRTVKKVALLLELPCPHPNTLIAELRSDMARQYTARGSIKEPREYYGHYRGKSAGITRWTVVFATALIVLCTGAFIYLLLFY